MTSKRALARSKEIAETAKEFLEASEKLLSRKTFFDGTQFYSGSLYPIVQEKIDSWRHSGAIPTSEAMSMYSSGAIADLSSIGAIKAQQPNLKKKFNNIYEKSKKELGREGLYGRMAEYQESLMRLASSSRVFQDTLSGIVDENNAWVEMAKANLDWIKKTVTLSIARVYQAFGALFDKATKKIDEITGMLSRWASELRKELVGKLRELSQHFVELLTSLLSALFSWISRLRQIAEEKGFRLNKVTVSLDPSDVTSVSVFGFSIPVLAIKLPKIEMEFS